MADKKEKISVIMAVYKAEPYLNKAVESVLSQTYKNLELVLVDDGSPDNSGAMCDVFANQDSRIKVIHKQNGGVSSAWNAGLDNASGEYICFVDSDDYVQDNYIQELYNALKKYDCDISICSATKVYDNGLPSEIDRTNSFDDHFYRVSEVYDLFFGERIVRHTAWGKLYKKELFSNIRYPEDIYCSEDTYRICELCSNVKVGVVTLPDRLYNYIIRGESISRKVTEKRFDWIKAARHRNEVMDKENPAYKNCCKQMFYAYVTLYEQLKKGKRKDLYKKFNCLLKEDWVKYSKYLTKKDRIKYGIFKNCRWLYFTIASIKRTIGK